VTELPDVPRDDALFRRIVEDSPAAVLLLTNEHATRVLYANPRVGEITGFTADELTGRADLWFGRMHPDGAAWQTTGLGSRHAPRPRSRETRH
jgi:PAS domain S-box-containing protein